jgi:hypothetical protein
MGQINSGSLCQKTRPLRIPHETHRLSGHRKAALHFRTDTDPIDKLSQYISQITVPFLASIIPYLLPKETAADPDFGTFRHSDPFMKKSKTRRQVRILSGNA